MRKLLSLSFSLTIFLVAASQKKPLDHSVYDGWQSIGEKMISNDGKWIVYTIEPQEGDGELVIQSSDARYRKSIARGYNAVITEDSRFLICRISPLFKETREARIKKKKTEDFPKDSLIIVPLGKDSIWRRPRVRNFKTPDKSSGWVAYLVDRPATPATKPNSGTSTRATDSLNRIIDSLKHQLERQVGKNKSNNRPAVDDPFLFGEHEIMEDADGDEAAIAVPAANADLQIRKLATGQETVYRNVTEYYFSKNGRKLLLEQARDPKDSLSKTLILLFDLHRGFADTLSRGGNDFKNFVLSEDGSQVAYLAERDARPKDLQKFYKIWYFKDGMDSARLLIDKNAVGMQLGMTISEFGSLTFSKNGTRLFFGTAPIQPPRDTTLVEMDQAKLDVWHYNDDYLQTMQLFRLPQDQHENFLAVYHLETGIFRQLGTKEIPIVYPSEEGNGDLFAGITDFGKRIESQWNGSTRKDIYAINVNDGTRKLIRKDLTGVINQNYISPGGKYIAWYDSKAKNYFAFDGESVRNISSPIKTALYNEENDLPTDPGPYGIMGWKEGDSVLYVYDRYDIWRLDPKARQLPTIPVAFNAGRKAKVSLRYVRTNPEERYITNDQEMVLRAFNEKNKESLLYFVNSPVKNEWTFTPFIFWSVRKAKDRSIYIYTKENFIDAPDLFVFSGVDQQKVTNNTANPTVQYPYSEVKLSAINPQQKDYNWGTAELYHWKTFTGKKSEGILYKPEDFNPAKKYPLILYFYEKLSDGLYSYIPPSPTPSRLNISFFVSRGYLVFAPDISYTIGHPAKSAYDYIVSAAKNLATHPWVDARNIGIQGQSWGGIQVAQLITMTDFFKAAWAGAPVANMTSAYGGIRWETGANRQFQYEKTQSRIGSTLWAHPELYIENSPLFHLPNVKTPLVIMSNDADGAVPWYQGIELFTGMRRLGKKVWMLNYNGEAHNLVQRRNRKDIQVREQQYFDWLLKGEKPAKWITEGVPAVRKGRDWGLELEN